MQFCIGIHKTISTKYGILSMHLVFGVKVCYNIKKDQKGCANGLAQKELELRQVDRDFI